MKHNIENEEGILIQGNSRENLVLITSNVQVELSKLNFDFDGTRTYFLQVLRDCQQITFVTLNRFCLLSNKKTHPSICNRQDQDGYNINHFLYIMFQVLKVFLIKFCKIQSLDLLFIYSY